jgi:coenzyme F420-reducing hydrogenase delta subunit/ferredoxin
MKEAYVKIKNRSGVESKSGPSGHFEPVILAFACNECAYAAADLAGTTHLQYPANIRIIRVPCSGQVDPIHILTAFCEGVDAVIVAGCLKGQCHYGEGNLHAEQQVNFLRELLHTIGIHQERLSMHFVSAAMSTEFVNIVHAVTSRVRTLGINPLYQQRPATTETTKMGTLGSYTSNALPSKRELFRTLLLTIIRKLRLRCDELQFFSEFPSYGEPILAVQDCTGCGGCAYVCKHAAFQSQIDAEEAKLYLSHTYWKCTACGWCEKICPQQCLKLNLGFNLAKFLTEAPIEKAVLVMKRCTECNTLLVPVSEITHLDELIKDKLGTTKAEFVYICTNCKRYELAEKRSRSIS